MSSQHFTYHWITKCASSTTTALTLPLNLTSFTVSSTKHSACPNSNLHASILAFVVPINPASGQCCLNITALESGDSLQIWSSIMAFKGETTIKPVFHERIFSHEATFFFCLNLISSTWFQPKAQGQREKVASRENIR